MIVYVWRAESSIKITGRYLISDISDGRWALVLGVARWNLLRAEGEVMVARLSGDAAPPAGVARLDALLPGGLEDGDYARRWHVDDVDVYTKKKHK